MSERALMNERGAERDETGGRALMNELDAYWAYRKQRSLRAASNRNAAELLLAGMYRWSTHQKSWGPNADSWVTKMEYLCWQRQPRLRALSVKAGGWWRWCDGVVFVQRKRWVRMFETWQRAEKAHQVAYDADALLERLTQKPKGGFEKWQAARRAETNP